MSRSMKMLNFVSILTLIGLLSAHLVFANQELLDAAERGDVAEVTRLLNDHSDHKKVNINLLGRQKYYTLTPLMAAAHKGHLEVVKLLLAKGAIVNKTNNGH